MAKILILGGTGAMGTYLVDRLKKSSHEVYVTSRSQHNSEENIHYLVGNAKNDVFLDELLQKNFDCIIDFMVYSTFEFVDRYKKILASTKHYIFLSSYRVYADNGTVPIKEDSPLLLDVTKDMTYKKTDEYALTKARQERLLQESGYRNFTIARPSITFSKLRFQLGTMEAGLFVKRALMHKKVVLPNEILTKYAAISWAGDVAEMLEAIILNPEAYGEIFNVCSSEKQTWREVAGYYHSFIGVEVVPVSLKAYAKIMGGWYQIVYDRMVNRIMDNSKILKLMEKDISYFSPVEKSLKEELSDIKEKSDDLPLDYKRSKKMDKILRKLFWRKLLSWRK